ncbi:glycosyltransferase family 4 protein [Dechloromonas denitrificans]|uniref:glycosyltransferase family 4 protein n=1 Tax=Dechloromonas denitrificans TaxID=281362 RepID=UPI001CF84FBC|nr:glycosyltransferase family 4 protein [Dechloromonas denitrificans]UCV12118.1 glycosyltransferase family 4 protein [Dechloromonas denitrificans]
MKKDINPPVIIATIMRPEGETGVQTHFRAIYEWFSKAGMQIDLITPFGAFLWIVYPVFGLRRLILLFSKPLSVWWYRYWHAVFLFVNLKKKLADGLPCIIYAQCPLSVKAALSARVSAAQKIIMVVHFNISQADEWSDRGEIVKGESLYLSIKKFENDILPKVDALIYVSDFMKRILEGRIPELTNVQSKVIPNFIFDPGVCEASCTSADLITIGTLEYRKNQKFALEIISAAKKLDRILKLTVVGDGPDRKMLEEYAVSLGVENQIVFLGFRKNAIDLLDGHQAYLHVAHIENLPLTLIEALAKGLPVFAPATGGIPEVFIDEVQGRFIPLDDPGVAAKLIIESLDNNDFMSEIKVSSRGRFLNNFSSDIVAQKIACYFKAVVLG